MLKSLRKIIGAIIIIVLTQMINMQSVKGELPPLVPMEDFFKNPVEAGHSLSPTGRKVAFLKPWKNRMNIFFQSVPRGKEIQVTKVTNRDISGFFWANDNKLAYILDEGGDENFHIYTVNLDGSGQKDLTPFKNTRASVIDDLENDQEHMIISHNSRDSRVMDVYRVHVDTGELELIFENPGNVVGYVTDHEGKLRIALSSDGVNNSVLYREDESKEFTNLVTTNFRESLSPLFFTFDNKKFYATSNLGRDKSAIVVYDPSANKEETVIYEHPQVDVSGLLRSDARKVVTGVSFVAAKRAYHFLDHQRREMQEFLESKFPGLEVSVVSSSLDESKFLIRTYSDKSRGDYHFLDYDKKEVAHLAEISPWINNEYMAPMEPISYQSRDGILIHGYLTLPVGIEAKGLPLVVLPHGGPWARDHWGYQPEVQFLANRGYVVLQMNFRGSTGYGRKFWEMSFKKWGKEMQNDITDGIDWLVSKGIVDPKKVGIYGASYGGYAVLAGMAFTPEIYACGVDYVGVSNLFTLLESIPPYWEPMRQMLYEMAGDPEKDKDLIKEISPVFHADKVAAPLFIAQGANDPRVKKAESDQMVKAMKKRGIDVPYMVKDNEGHGFRNEENRFEFYRAMEQFLSKHLHGRIGEGKDILSSLE